MADKQVYGLLDKQGKIFYVGQSKNVKNRMNAYKNGYFHNNAALEAKVKKNGVNFCILVDKCDDINAAEFEQIAKHNDLVNVIIGPNKSFQNYAKKPWTVRGTKCPSAAVMQMMQTRFGTKYPEIKKHLKSLCDKDRVNAEIRIAFAVMNSPDAHICKKWVEGINVSA